VSSKATHRALVTISENIALARDFVSGLTLDTFGSDQRSIYAVTRCLEIISEAVRRLPDDLIARHPSVPWSDVKAAGNVYRHEYDNLSPKILWATVEEGLEGLAAAVAAELASAP
jgi:uncharacterized protein with HEPN domain